MMKKVFLILSMLAVLLAACGAKASPSSVAPLVREEQYLTGQNAEPSTAVSGANGSNQPEPKRIVIKNASLSIAVDDPAKSSETIGKMAEEMGGFVVSEDMYQTTTSSGATVLHSTLTIRVPVENLNEALNRIKAESNQPVIRQNLSSQDVTLDYTDLQSRLRNAEAAEAELTKFLDSAQKTDDVLSVYAQLKAIREEIELLKGQIQYYEQSAALSAITVELEANAALKPISVGGWQPVGIAKDAIQTLITALQWLGQVSIWFLLFCTPLLLIIGLPVALVVVVIRRQVRKARRVVKAAPVAASSPGGNVIG